MDYEVTMVRQMIADGVIPQDVAEKYFPELKESEDERIRETLIENFKWYCGDYPETTKWGKDDNLLVKDIIAWLEKQGEQKQELLTKEKALKNSPFVEQKPTNIVTVLNDYFANTPKEQQDKDWEELKYLNDIGPDIEIAFGAKDSELIEATYFIPKGFLAEIDGDKVKILIVKSE